MWRIEGSARPSVHHAASVSSRWTRSASAAASRTRSANRPEPSWPSGRRTRPSRAAHGLGGGTSTSSTGRSAGTSPGTAKPRRAARACPSTPCSRRPRSSPTAILPGAPPSGDGGCVRTTSARTERIVTDRPAKVPPVRGDTERPAGRRPGPELSVVICTVGHAAVGETVASVAASAGRAAREVEIVVVWQGSSEVPDLEGSASVTAVFPAGLSYARNRGLALAHAPLVAFVDDDEVVDEAWVGAVLETFDRVPAAAVFGPVAPRDDRGLPYCRYDGGGELRVVSGERALPWTVGTGGNMAYRRDELVELGGFDILFGLGAVARSAEDTELILRLLCAGRSVAWSPHVVVYHPSKTAG